MNKSGIFKITALMIFICVLVSACSASGPKDDSSKKSQTTTAKKTTLPPLETSSTTTFPGTRILGDMPFLTPEAISTTWPKSRLCSLVTPQQAQNILDMATTPAGRYTFTAESGAKCTFRSSSGEEISIQIATTTFASARVVDNAISEPGKPATIEGFGAVVKNSPTFGITYEINIGGEQSNQWVANAPTRKSAESLARTLILALK